MKGLLHFCVPVALVLASCGPFRSFEKKPVPPAPEYSNEKNWIALPWKKDLADTVPSGCPTPQSQDLAEADVFFIHPTLYMKGRRWNASLKNRKVNKNSARTAMYQASAFNSSCKVYMPRYRQAVLKSFFSDKGIKPLELAYSDIKKAFEYYLEHWNKGRPIIIAGHSQGARHAMQLLADLFDGKELSKQLVAAYPIGIPFEKDKLKNIQVCKDGGENGCYVTWNTMSWGTNEQIRDNTYQFTPCVNPLTMKTTEEHAPDTMNKGGVSFQRYSIDMNICDAKVNGNILWIHQPWASGYFKVYRSYHLCDFNLFYVNIRRNAELKVKNFLQKR